MFKQVEILHNWKTGLPPIHLYTFKVVDKYIYTIMMTMHSVMYICTYNYIWLYIYTYILDEIEKLYISRDILWKFLSMHVFCVMSNVWALQSTFIRGQMLFQNELCHRLIRTNNSYRYFLGPCDEVWKCMVPTDSSAHTAVLPRDCGAEKKRTWHLDISTSTLSEAPVTEWTAFITNLWKPKGGNRDVKIFMSFHIVLAVRWKVPFKALT